MLNTAETLLRRLRRSLSRSEWLVRILGLEKSHGTSSNPGLVLIQIDGLSRHHLERAMKQGRLPFLRQLLEKHQYRLHSLYSGMPSSTPGMLGELFYGVRCAVPAFSFLDRAAQSVFRMFEPHTAKEIEEGMHSKGTPLLAEGSAYGGIYTGGARESHFCIASMGLSDLFHRRHRLRLLLLALLNLYSLLRIGTLFVIEFFLALVDCLRGLFVGQDLWKEIKFIPSRVGICILMRELATIGAKMDVARGLPVIYLDLIGYDEQSHRRGPSSRFAYWSLKGIDGAIARIWRAAHRSSRREYDVWVFSDHGSEDVLSYVREHGRPVEVAVGQTLEMALDAAVMGEQDDRGVQSRRSGAHLPWRFFRADDRMGNRESKHGRRSWDGLVVTAMGPLGHVYVNQPTDGQERERLAKALVEQAEIPMVLAAEGLDKVRVWTKDGKSVLPEQAAAVLAPDHPFMAEVAEDLVALCQHKDAGDFVISGWNRAGRCYSFPSENGGHAGPGLEETHAFALMPVDVPLSGCPAGHLRPVNLRQAALRHLERETVPAQPVPAVVSKGSTLRLLTYNVHTCVGLDGKLSARRIARVIARYRPDVVALQEVDVGRARTNHTDQARVIAEYLEMECHFHPAMRLEEEAYGDCILSRLPMRLVKADRLPTLASRNSHEPRGALWVTVTLGPICIELINTHLGLRASERSLQVQALLGNDWIGSSDRSRPIVLCGDFNASPGSIVWGLCTNRFGDVQVQARAHKPRRTWFGRYPIARVDHIFVSPQVSVISVDVGDDHLARIASDHRPLFAELEIGG